MNCRLIFAAFCAVLLCCPGFARAGDIAYGPYYPSVLAGCDAPKPQELEMSSIQLQSEDSDSIALARAYTAKLEAEGQDSRIIKSIYKASLRSGVDFELLLMKAIMESDLGRFNVAARSTARGPFQYIEPTWLTLIKRYGAQAGYPHYANAIRESKYSGVPFVAGQNTYLKAEILALRHDPDAAALINAYQIKEETDVIRNYKGGQEVTPTDHYIAHMMGLPLAREFYDLRRTNSIIAVARLNRPEMREAASLNRAFFYEGPRALTAAESYRVFERRIGHEQRKIREVADYQPLEILCTASNDTRL